MKIKPILKIFKILKELGIDFIRLNNVNYDLINNEWKLQSYKIHTDDYIIIHNDCNTDVITIYDINAYKMMLISELKEYLENDNK